MGSLIEVKRVWTLDELLQAHDVLDYREAVEARVMAAQTRGRR